MAKFFREYIFKLFVAVAVTSTVTALALIGKYWTWPNAIVGGILLLCGVLYLMDRLGIGPSTKSRVRDWLDASGYSVRTVSDSNEFHFVMTDNIGLVTDILQERQDAPIRIVSANHKASPERIAKFKALSKPAQDAFWRNVRLELLRYGLQFSDLTLEGEGMHFSDSVMPGRSLTSVDLLKRILFVRSGSRLYWELVSVLDDATHAQSAIATTPKQLANPPTSTPLT